MFRTSEFSRTRSFAAKRTPARDSDRAPRRRQSCSFGEPRNCTVASHSAFAMSRIYLRNAASMCSAKRALFAPEIAGNLAIGAVVRSGRTIGSKAYTFRSDFVNERCNVFDYDTSSSLRCVSVCAAHFDLFNTRRGLVTANVIRALRGQTFKVRVEIV